MTDADSAIKERRMREAAAADDRLGKIVLSTIGLVFVAMVGLLAWNVEWQKVDGFYAGIVLFVTIILAAGICDRDMRHWH